jgi:hypothetical protein
MAAALRCAARKIYGRYAEAAIKEGRQRLLPRIRHGASSLRRFTSSESASLLHNTTPKGLAKQIESKKHQVLNLLGQMEAESSMTAEHKELQQVLQVNNNRFLANVYKGNVITGIGTMLAAFATAIVGTKVFLPRQED